MTSDSDIKVQRRVRFLGLDFDNRSMTEALDEIIECAKAKTPFRYVVTPNVHHVVKASEAGSGLQNTLSGAWRTFCDSRLLRGLARTCGIELMLITGSDLTAQLIGRASGLGMSATIIGPSAQDCAHLAKRFPGLRIRSYSPPLGFIAIEREVEKCVEFVAGTGSDLTFLAVGMPQQEILAARIAAAEGATGIGLCIGASIDFLTGKQVRAPRWLQLAHLEWAYRLASDPRRLARRYLIECPRIFPLVIGHLFASRRPRKGLDRPGPERVE